MPSLAETVERVHAETAGTGGYGASAPVTRAAPELPAAEREAARILEICNACRYCEGFCAVFPAMTRRLEFGHADVHYLANLCHNCGACLHACQYAPPHEFAVNVPVALAEVRGTTYHDYAWPRPFGELYRRNGLTVSLALAAGIAAFLALAVAMHGSLAAPPEAGGNFYSVFPHNLMVGLFAPVFLFAVLALGIGVTRFWRDVKPATSGVPVAAPAAAEAAGAVLTMRYLDGGHGKGCHEDDEGYTLARRRYHHLTFYGFALCFAATSLATIYHYVFGWQAPYDLPELPKVLGALGGVGLIAGTLGLGLLHLRRHHLHVDSRQRPMDLGFIALLLLIAATGMALWLARATAAMPLLLCLHLGAVIALFATMPYGKFAHGIFRSASLLRYAAERRQPNPVGLGEE